jgi:membrane protease YdiL (CAAX protease family)
MSAQIVRYKAQALQPRNLLVFFLIALGLNWLKATLVFFDLLKAQPAFTDPAILVVALAGWTPTLAAFLVTAITEGKPGVSALWKRFWRHDFSARWLLVTLLFIPAVWLLANILTRLLGGWANRLFDRPQLFFVQFALGLSAGLGEEFGWRGYALPRFQHKWSALASSLILGLIWTAWHTRFFTTVVLGPLFRGIPPESGIWEWLVWIVISSVLTTWIYNNTHGSILAAVLFHAMMNAGSFIFWCCTASWHWPTVLAAVAIAIVLLFGPRDLLRRRAPGESVAVNKGVGS